MVYDVTVVSEAKPNERRGAGWIDVLIFTWRLVSERGDMKPCSLFFLFPSNLELLMSDKKELEEKFLRYLKRTLPQLSTSTQNEWCLCREWEFSATSKFRFDFCFPWKMIAFEVNGSIWQKGGHTSAYGVQRDYEKLNLAMSIGWRVFQITNEMMKKEKSYLNPLMADILSSLTQKES